LLADDRLPRGARAWAGLAALLCTLAIGATLAPRWLPAESIDWQPALALHQPWRAFSAAALHYSTLHLAANLLGALLVGALGVVARVPLAMTVAWCVAWPLTQLGLLLQPELRHFGGLSGVLHAGTAVVATHLLLAATGRRRAIGGAILLCVCIKVASEEPWGAPLRTLAGWDIAVAPLAHATGLAAGVLCAVFAHLITRQKENSEVD
jgi:rhomboid family GlyGly-CTERM serine protease